MARSVRIQQAIDEAERYLCVNDSKMASLIDEHGPCTIYQRPALFHKTAYHVLVWSIINQQLSVASARSIERRLRQHHPRDTFQANVIDGLDDETLRRCGLSRQKIRYIRALGSGISNGEINPSRLHTLDNDSIAVELQTIPGIGPWTVDMFLMFYLGRLDVLPLGDLALRKAISLTYEVDDIEDMHQLGSCWAPYRTIASWYLWCVVD